MAEPMTDHVVCTKGDAPEVSRHPLPIVGSAGGWKNDR